MFIPHLDSAQIAYFTRLVSQYVASQRAAYIGMGVPMDQAQQGLLAPFFRANLAGEVRVVLQEHVVNPPFYPQLRRFGLVNLPDFSAMAAITFVDVVVSRVPLTTPLLFHELVHVVQYAELGVEAFPERYVQGFLRGGSYERIPLEMNAYELGRRFEADPRRSFSAEAEVIEWINDGRL